MSFVYVIHPFFDSWLVLHSKSFFFLPIKQKKNNTQKYTLSLSFAYINEQLPNTEDGQIIVQFLFSSSTYIKYKLTFLHHSSVKSCNVNRCQVGIFLSFLRYRYSALIFVIDILRKHYGYTRNTSSHAIFFILPILDWLLEGTESGRSNDLDCESK